MKRRLKIEADNKTRDRLVRHAARMAELQEQGLSREEASRQAYVEIIRRKEVAQ